MKVAVVGGGAAGFFAAIQVKENYPEAQVILFEKSRRVLQKVSISGGGRCNVTNGCTTIKSLAEGYPRGGKRLKKAFRIFNNQDTQNWFQKRGVPLKTEADNRVFPTSNNSQSIIDCLMKAMQKHHIPIAIGTAVDKITEQQNGLKVYFADGNTKNFDKVIIATGGSPKAKGLDWLADLGHRIAPPVPSLFTFNMPN
ncbi:MAG: aminoacetone oxidase family FAD-binding enzyme, partial [Bacteroidota bacterium]